ncbi:AAA family ATPase [Chelativorans sp.]|uniref:AAA family ATPase n=1 Tax=Chelativorans sp. TaxID=2203393 RepID=UPI002810C677|nr:AAA family ATPase [Chelativorans sp.]
MRRVLITGMSATGKSTVITELHARGFDAVDLDTPEWSHWIDCDPSDTLTPTKGKDWVWREHRVRELLSAPREQPLFVSGCAENMERLFPWIDRIVLLSAPLPTILDRLAQRGPGAYGRDKEERENVVALISTVEPLLREVADVEIATTGPLSETVEEIAALVRD